MVYRLYQQIGFQNLPLPILPNIIQHNQHQIPIIIQPQNQLQNQPQPQNQLQPHNQPQLQNQEEPNQQPYERPQVLRRSSRTIKAPKRYGYYD